MNSQNGTCIGGPHDGQPWATVNIKEGHISKIPCGMEGNKMRYAFYRLHEGAMVFLNKFEEIELKEVDPNEP